MEFVWGFGKVCLESGYYSDERNDGTNRKDIFQYTRMDQIGCPVEE